MNLPDGLLAGEWSLAAWLIFLPVFLRLAWRAPWRCLADASRLNAWLGGIVVLMLLWCLNAGIRPGLSLHLVGAAVLTLAFGTELAFIGLCATLLGVTANGAAGWESFAANALLTGGVGVLVTAGVQHFTERFLPQQMFVYIFVNGFFGAALTAVAVGLATSLLLLAAGTYDAGYLFNDYLPYVCLLAFAEAWLSGMVITLFVVYRPAWVATFDDARYLRDR